MSDAGPAPGAHDHPSSATAAHPTGPLTASGAVDPHSMQYWAQENLTVTTAHAVRALHVTVRVSGELGLPDLLLHPREQWDPLGRDSFRAPSTAKRVRSTCPGPAECWWTPPAARQRTPSSST